MSNEREAFEHCWQIRGVDDEGNLGAMPLRSTSDPESYRGSAVNGSWIWFKKGAEWQRSQIAPAGCPADDSDDQLALLALVIAVHEEKHGGLRAAAKALGIDPAYLSRLKSGEKTNPSAEVLAAFGLERRSYYRPLLAAAPKAECTNSDSWNCKYCNKTKDCEALKDPRNFAAPKAEQPPVQEPLAQYDAGLLNDFGGGNVEWWQDYLRAELGRAHDFYQSQIPIAAPQPVSDAYRMAVDTGLVCAHIGVTNQEDDYETARKKLNDLICWSVQVDRDLGPADALVEGLETIALESSDEQARCCAHHYLAAYRAAMESNGDE